MTITTGARKALGTLARIAFAIVAAYAALLLGLIALTRAMHSGPLRERIVSFNRRRLNPLTLRIAGSRSRVYAAVHHVGRRSGRAYTTPVVAEPLGAGFIIPLPYETDVDWLRNVLAAGGCTLTWNETEYQLDQPEVIPAKDALRAFPWSQRIIFAGGGITHFLTLRQRRLAAEAAPMGGLRADGRKARCRGLGLGEPRPTGADGSPRAIRFVVRAGGLRGPQALQARFQPPSVPASRLLSPGTVRRNLIP